MCTSDDRNIFHETLTKFLILMKIRQLRWILSCSFLVRCSTILEYSSSRLPIMVTLSATFLPSTNNRYLAHYNYVVYLYHVEGIDQYHNPGGVQVGGVVTRDDDR